jgi:hypothetical protein
MLSPSSRIRPDQGEVVKRLLLITVFMFWAHGAAIAASAVIVDSAYVADALKRNAIVWDVRPADAYAKGHVPALSVSATLPGAA